MIEEKLGIVRHRKIRNFTFICREAGGAESCSNRPWTGRPSKRGSIPGRSNKFPLLGSVETNPGTFKAPYIKRKREYLPRLKRPGLEAVHSPPSIAPFRRSGVIPPLPHGVLLNYLNTVTAVP